MCLTQLSVTQGVGHTIHSLAWLSHAGTHTGRNKGAGGWGKKQPTKPPSSQHTRVLGENSVRVEVT